jgi:ABC-type lipoprotein release transport system permease subunit
MTYLRIAKRGLRFYWKTHAAAGLAVLVATAVLAGALTVGDSIRATLSRRTAMRLGKVEAAVTCRGLFRAELASEMESKLALQRSRTAVTNQAAVTVGPILKTTGFAENADASVRVGDIQVLGVDPRFWKMGPADTDDIVAQPDNTVAVSRSLARRLNLEAGQDIVVKMQAAGGMPVEALLSQQADKRVSFRRRVEHIVEDEQFGGFDLYSRPDGGLNVYISLQQLNELFGYKDRLWANMLLFAGAIGSAEIGPTLSQVWQLDDAGLGLYLVDWPRVLELRSRDVFIADTIASRIGSTVPGGRGVLTYFANEFRCGDKSVPYSFISAIEGTGQEDVFTSLAQNELVLNEWLADQLKASEGDKIEIRYFVPSQGKRLSEQRETFVVKSVVPMMGTGADATLMPAIESMADAENCRDWDAGIPIDLSKIRPADEQYWDKYKGAPKAFVSMQTAKLLWSSRFGTLTAMRFSVDRYDPKTLRSKILSAIEPWQAGFVVQDVQQAGRKSARATTDFGGLTVGLSMFLIAASLILAGLVWSFGLQRRTGQIGILLATGFTKGQAGELLLLEEIGVILFAAIAGAAGGLCYTQWIIRGLNSIWAGAAGGIEIVFAWRWQTAILAAGISVAAALIVWLLRIRRLWRRPATDLLDRSEEIFMPRGNIGLAMAAAVTAGLAAVGMGIYGTQVAAQEAAGLFFGCGAMMLIAAGLFLSAGLSYLAVRAGQASKSLCVLAVKNAARRKGRSLAVTLTLAMGVFVVLATGVFQQVGPPDATIKDSGTGGFTLWAQSSIGLANDLGDVRFGREAGFLSADSPPLNAVSIRVLPAEDASCLNIAQVRQPSLWGVPPEAFSGRFRFKKLLEKNVPANPWEMLNQNIGQDVIPAIGDWATVYWGLHKDIGDQIEYTDRSGRVFRLEIVGLLDDSIWQGGLLISEKQFLKRYEDGSGWNVFLIDVPLEQLQSVSEKLTQSLSVYGVTLQTTADKLAQFHQVQNTYIRIFMVLGAMGLVLGTVGAGLVVLLNVLDRMGELAMMRACGFEKKKLRRMLFLEHAGLLTAGLFLGVVSAIVAAGPQIGRPENLPWKMMAGLVAVMWISGLVWVQVAAMAAMRGDLLEPLRKE